MDADSLYAAAIAAAAAAQEYSERHRIENVFQRAAQQQQYDDLIFPQAAALLLPETQQASNAPERYCLRASQLKQWRAQCIWHDCVQADHELAASTEPLTWDAFLGVEHAEAFPPLRNIRELMVMDDGEQAKLDDNDDDDVCDDDMMLSLSDRESASCPSPPITAAVSSSTGDEAIAAFPNRLMVAAELAATHTYEPGDVRVQVGDFRFRSGAPTSIEQKLVVIGYVAHADRQWQFRTVPSPTRVADETSTAVAAAACA